MTEETYVERLSAAQVVRRFDRNDPPDKILNHLSIKVFNLDEPIELPNEKLADPCIVEIVGHNSSKASRWDVNALNNLDNIFALRYVNIQVNAAITTSILKPLLTSKCLVYLTMLDLSHTKLSLELIQTLGKTMNVLTSGYCPIKRLLLSRCSLGVKGGTELLENLASNIYLEELLLNGNGMTDAAIEPLLAFINSHSVCHVGVLSVADNGFTTLGMSRLGYALRSNHCLRELHLHDNNHPPGGPRSPGAISNANIAAESGVFDEALDGLFISLTENPLITTVNISNCSLRNCVWGDHVRILTTLTSLFVNNNVIDDEGCAVLCSALSINCSIRTVDLSNNVFSGHQNSNCIGAMLQANCTLNRLLLCGNVMADDVWSSIANGLALNDTLLLLDCQWCELTVQQGQSLCHALCASPGTQHKGNDICALSLGHNPLPAVMTDNPRAYARTLEDGTAAHVTAGNSNNIVHWDAGGGPDGESVVRYPDSSIVATTVNGADQRRARRYEIVHATQAMAILAEADRARAEASEGDGDDAVDTGTLAFHIEHETGLAFEHQEHVLPGFVRAQQERKQAAAAEASVVRGRRVLTVGYGYASEVIGTIHVEHATTYADAHRKVRGLVQQYLSNNDQVMVADLLENYTFVDPNSPEGLSVPHVDTQFRTVWAEAAVVGCVLVVRPANWVVLGGADSDGDEGDEHRGQY
mgnify:CR=1 FL=1